MQTTKWRMKSIMLAEDDEDDRMMFKEVIQQVNPGFTLQIVSDGHQLLSLLENILPDILFLDLDMPYKNGLECLVAIRENEKMQDLPVVMFSSTTRQANIQTAYEMGAHLFLIKSAYFKEYVASVNAILELDWSNPGTIKEQYCVNNRYVAFT
jgi:DNA-binding response OmpR family regulator